MENIKKELITVSVDDLKPYPGNPRRNNKSSKIVAESINNTGILIQLLLLKI
mgnify:CR=1 FL=1